MLQSLSERRMRGAKSQASLSAGSGALLRMTSDAFSAIISTQALICAETRSGMTEASTTDRKSTRLNSSHLGISYAVFCLKKKTKQSKTYRVEESREDKAAQWL